MKLTKPIQRKEPLKMRNHKLAKNAARKPKKKAHHKSQRAAQAVVRSPTRGRRAGVRSTEPSRKRQNGPEPEALVVENPARIAQHASKQAMTDNAGANVFSATAKVGAYQTKLLEMAQANVLFTFDLAQRLATIRSFVEFPGIVAEFTSNRIAMLGKYSSEMGEISIKG